MGRANKHKGLLKKQYGNITVEPSQNMYIHIHETSLMQLPYNGDNIPTRYHLLAIKKKNSVWNGLSFSGVALNWSTSREQETMWGVQP